MNKLSQISTAAVFIIIIAGLFLWFVLSADKDVSDTERRKLARLEAPTTEAIMSGSWFKDFDKYAADQFPLRDEFRGINAAARKNLLLQQDINGLYTVDNNVFKSDYPLSAANINNFVKKTNQIYSEHIKGMANNYFVSVIPDKSHFDASDHLVTDARRVAQIFTDGAEGAEYIDIFDALRLDAYYRTDTHWSQDRLFPVMDVIAEKMGFIPPDETNWISNYFEPFYGVYHGQSALNPKPDTLVYMTSEFTDSATVENTDKPNFKEVYDVSELQSRDSYNVFLSGGTPLTKITSPLSKTEKELVIFRDSFGSSIAPLFLEEYRTVTLIDLRYFSSSLLKDYVDFRGKDVLVLYSSLILNSSIQLK